MPREPVPPAERFSFVERPSPLPADLRISWRLSLLLLMLRTSRAKKASLAKLHVINDAIRSASARERFQKILGGDASLVDWRVRVEPAFGRAINFLVGEKFAAWTKTSQRAALQLTKQGIEAAEKIASSEGILEEEKFFLSSVSASLTEQFVTDLLKAGDRK